MPAFRFDEETHQSTSGERDIASRWYALPTMWQQAFGTPSPDESSALDPFAFFCLSLPVRPVLPVPA